MFSISDIADLVKGMKEVFVTNGKDSTGKDGKNGIAKNFLKVFNKDAKSINRRAKKNIFQFPLLVSDNIETETLSSFRRASEREYASLVQYVIAGDDVIDLDDKESKENFIKKFHTNHSINSIDSDGGETGDVKQIGADVTELSDAFKGMFEGKSFDISDNIISLIEGNLLNYNNEEIRLLNIKELTPFKENLNDIDVNSMTINNINILDEGNKEAGSKTKEVDPKKEVTKMDTNVSEEDIKKINSKLPTRVQIKVSYRIDGVIQLTELLIGVSCVSHLIPSDEMIYFLSKSIAEDNFVFRAIQWTTGEIKFFKDFVLSLDRITYENSTHSSSSSKWWNHLRKLGKKSKLMTLFGKEEFIPNSTIAVSMAEVDYMKNSEGIDFMRSASQILDNFFLMRLVVLDDTSEVAYYYNDDTRDWNRFTYSELFRSDKNGSSSDIKALVDLISR